MIQNRTKMYVIIKFNKHKSIIIFIVSFLFFNTSFTQNIKITTADILENIVSGRDTGVIIKDSVRFAIIKTGGSTIPLNITYPTGAPINTLPKAKFSRVEGLHLGRTWGENGTERIDEKGQLNTEQYTFSFSENLSELSFVLGGINNNLNGVERFKIVDVKNDSLSVLAKIKFTIRVDFDDDESDSYIFDPKTREIKGQDFPKQAGWEESAIFKITSSVPFNTVLVERKDYENLRPDKIIFAQNYPNGVTLTNFNLILAPPVIIDNPKTDTVVAILEELQIGVDLTKKLEVKPIYFDYNKADINPVAASELDKIVKFMNENPTVEIEIRAHTDCRGSSEYNLSLSNARANSSVKYIQENITSPNRIFGKGYGESELINECKCDDNNEKACSEEQHQENRRTEFILIKD